MNCGLEMRDNVMVLGFIMGLGYLGLGHTPVQINDYGHLWSGGGAGECLTVLAAGSSQRSHHAERTWAAS